jgi:uncharacterized protein (UPF0212 family)
MYFREKSVNKTQENFVQIDIGSQLCMALQTQSTEVLNL